MKSGCVKWSEVGAEPKAGSDGATRRRRRDRPLSAVKTRSTIEIDDDIIAWFTRWAPRGHGYQARINNALRNYVRVSEQGAVLRLSGCRPTDGASKSPEDGGLDKQEAEKIVAAVAGGEVVFVVLPSATDSLAVAEELRVIGIEEIDIVLKSRRGRASAQD